MKTIKNHIPLLLVYLLGINLYFCFWYLGSEGSAVKWSFDELTFFHLWVAASPSSIIVFVGFVIFRWYSNHSMILHFQSNQVGLLVQWGLGTFFFLVFLMIGIGFEVPREIVRNYIKTSGFLSISFYHFSLFLMVITVANLNDRLGSLKRVVTYLFKTFSAPKLLERGFMFLDLNSSTQIAEKLKSEKYSLFIRHCFGLLDLAVEKYRGIEIYQYAGDEAILNWDYHDRVKCTEAIYIFKRFRKLLDEHEHYFISEYGVKPTFKAAIHGGPVVQSELGRKMIHTAFHGDVLNTTSRILGICHKHETDLLLSKEYFQKLSPVKLRDNYEQIDDVVLNGKKQRLTVYKPVKIRSKNTLNHIFYD